jgi:hypothetical protein
LFSSRDVVPASRENGLATHGFSRPTAAPAIRPGGRFLWGCRVPVDPKNKGGLLLNWRPRNCQLFLQNANRTVKIPLFRDFDSAFLSYVSGRPRGPDNRQNGT